MKHVLSMNFYFLSIKVRIAFYYYRLQIFFFNSQCGTFNKIFITPLAPKKCARYILLLYVRHRGWLTVHVKVAHQFYRNLSKLSTLFFSQTDGLDVTWKQRVAYIHIYRRVSVEEVDRCDQRITFCPSQEGKSCDFSPWSSLTRSQFPKACLSDYYLFPRPIFDKPCTQKFVKCWDTTRIWSKVKNVRK